MASLVLALMERRARVSASGSAAGVGGCARKARNDDGEQIMSSKERRADTKRAKRARNKERDAEARALEHELQPSNPKSHSALGTERLSCAEQPTECASRAQIGRPLPRATRPQPRHGEDVRERPLAPLAHRTTA